MERHQPSAEKARIAELEAKLAEAEETLRAIHSGEVDALLVAGPEGDQVFTLQGADTTYRFLVGDERRGVAARAGGNNLVCQCAVCAVGQRAA